MKIKMKTSLFADGINTVSKAVSNKSTLPILQSILLMFSEGSVKMLANDLELAIETKQIEAEVEGSGQLAIDAKLLVEISKKLPDEYVEIEINEKNIAIIRSGRAEFKILGQKGADFPLLPDVEKDSFIEIEASRLKSMIKQTIFSISIEENRPILTGALFEIEDNIFKMVAIDGFRVSIREESINSDEEIKFVVPGKTLNEISRIISDNNEIIRIYFTDKHAMFETEGSLIVSRLLEGEYVNYENLFVEDFNAKVIIKKDELLESLERTLIVSNDQKKNRVILHVLNGSMLIKNETEIGEVFDEINVTVEGDEIMIAFNTKYILDILRNVNEDYVKMHFITKLSPCIIRGIGEDNLLVNNYKYLVLPLNI